MKLKIYCNGKNRPIAEALDIITPQWVESGESCQQTTIDLAKACRKLRDDLDHINRKVAHGCTDASCLICDGR